MQSKSHRKISLLVMLVSVLWLLGTVRCSQVPVRGGSSVIVTVGLEDADVIGNDNRAIQKAIDRVTTAGGGTVTIKAGTYTLNNSVRLASHITLEGEGADKTILIKGPSVRSRLKMDADISESQVTVEDPQGFAPGMGVTVMNQKGWQGLPPNVRTIERLEANTLWLDRYLGLDCTVEQGGEVANSFGLIIGYELENASIMNLTVDGNRTGTEPDMETKAISPAAIYFYHSKKFSIRNCTARNFAGDGISTQFVEDPIIESCQAYGNAALGIHLGTGALRGIVRHNRSHHNGDDGLYLCYRVQHALYEENQSWGNGQDGISIGHKDTDNLFVKNVVHDNGRAGVYFRNDKETNAGHRNTLRENLIENNGRPNSPGYGVRIDGATRHITLDSNTIRETRAGEQATQHVGIYIGPAADYIICSQNVLEGHLKHAVVSESKNTHNKLDQFAGSQEAEARRQR